LRQYGVIEAIGHGAQNGQKKGNKTRVCGKNRS